jgi:transcriptional regulator with XRE-family HTH domain
MSYQTLPFADDLRRARAAKGWSQRELSAKAGMTQAHLSNIERGSVDLRLSTLIELSRLLDLEVVLAPRNALTAIQALVREAQARSEFKTVRAATTALNEVVRQLGVDYPRDPTVDQLADLSREIYAMTAAVHTRHAMGELTQAIEDLQDAARRGRAPSQLRRHLDRLRDLRNALAHGRPEAERPAYSLDDDDEG